jgi:hypothetical protein
MLHSSRLFLLLALATATVAGSGGAQVVDTAAFRTAEGVAIRGFDPVAYFLDGGPKAGSPAFTASYQGATWQFASAEHRDLFVREPARYAPQYGGYCAFGVAGGYKAPISPDAWSVVDGKLYLNYNKGVQSKWKSDIPGYLVKSEANWPTVRTQKPKG